MSGVRAGHHERDHAPSSAEWTIETLLERVLRPLDKILWPLCWDSSFERAAQRGNPDAADYIIDYRDSPHCRARTPSTHSSSDTGFHPVTLNQDSRRVAWTGCRIDYRDPGYLDPHERRPDGSCRCSEVRE